MTSNATVTNWANKVHVVVQIQHRGPAFPSPRAFEQASRRRALSTLEDLKMLVKPEVAYLNVLLNLIFQSTSTWKYFQSSRTWKYFQSSRTWRYFQSSRTWKYLQSSRTWKYFQSSRTWKYFQSSSTWKYFLSISTFLQFQSTHQIIISFVLGS